MVKINEETIHRLLDVFKEKGDKGWCKIYSIFIEVLREVAQRKRWILLDQLHTEVSSLTINIDEGNRDDFMNELAYYMCRLYFDFMSCSRTSQRIVKIIQVLNDKHPNLKSILSKEIERLYDVSSEESTLQQIFNIIDSWSLGRSCIEDKLDTLWLKIIGEWAQEMTLKIKESSQSNIISYQDNLQLIIKISLQMFQHFSTTIQHILQSNNSNYDEARTHITSIVTMLMSVIFSKHLAKECLLLSGTSLSLFLNMEPDSSQVINAVMQLLLHAGMELSASMSSSIASKGTISITNISILLPPPDRLPITQIALLQAIITSSRKDIILYQMPDKDKLVLTDLVFTAVCHLCKTEKTPVVHYLSYEVAQCWMRRVKVHLKDIHDVDDCLLFSVDSIYTSSILELVWDSLEDLVDGVSVSGRSIFGLLLESHHEEQRIAKTDNKMQGLFYVSLLEKVLVIPWQVKAKYGLLSEILPYVTLNQIFSKCPALVQEMCECLRSNQLASACTEVFKALLLKSKQEENAEFQEKWVHALLNALTSDYQLLSLHARQYWLPCVLKTLPHTVDTLLSRLTGRHGNQSHLNQVLSAKLAIHKAARSLGIMGSEQLDIDLLKETLQHQEDNLRLEALGVLCCDVKTSKPVADTELQLLCGFLPHNMNIACPSFRQELFVAMKKVLCRIRDSSLFSLKKNYPKLFKKSQLEKSDFCQISLVPDIQHSLEFIKWVFQLVTNSLLPGANYQRQKTALEFLSLMFDTFVVTGNPDKRKGQAPESCRVLILLMEQKISWNIYSPRSVYILLGCLQSSHSDIRELALDVLQKHFTAPFKAIDSKTTDVGFALELMREATRLICSAKAQECESGSILCQLVFESYVVHLKWRITDIFGEVSVQSQNNDSTIEDDLCSEFLAQLVSETERQVSLAKKDLGLAAEQGPIHGILLTLCRCISSHLDLMSANQSVVSQSFSTVVQRTIDVALDAIDYLLGVLSKRQDSQNVVCGASFAGLGEAVSDALSTSSPESANQISQQHMKEFIMSCCFLSIKFGCHLLASVVEKSFKLPSQHTLLTRETLVSIGEKFIEIFTQCRLTGILLSCKLSLMSVCRCFSASDVECLYSLPRRWIQNVIEAISGEGAASSVTRRSAGLPVLIANILASEIPSKRQLTVKYCFDELLKIAFAPIPDVIDQTTDLPQVHAMNILRLLYQDTALGSDVLQYTEQGFILTVNGFASSLWSIRNAATQLFGSLVLRTLGQKRGFQDENQVNCISAKDFFKRFPSLRLFFLEQLQSCSSNGNKTRSLLKPELFPILTLLSKLRPVATDAQENLLADFGPALIPLSSNPVHAVRVLAAQALVPFIPVERAASKAAELLQRIPCSPDNVSQNKIHGILLQVHRLVDSISNPRATQQTPLIMEELLHRSWLGGNANTCAVTRAEYMTLVLDVKSLISVCNSEPVMKKITADYAIVSNGRLQVGLSSLQRAIVLNRLDMVKHEGSANLSPMVAVVKQGLTSSERETRIATLECVNELLQHKITYIRDIHQALTSLISMETDQRCLLLALECFIDMKHPPEQIHSEDWTLIWSPVLSYARGLRGSTIQSKAIAVLSILIRSVAKQLGSQEAQQIVSMVTDWLLSVSNCSFPSQPEPVRSGAALGLGIAGADVILWAQHCTDKTDVIHAVVRVFQTGVMLLEDEQDDVRIEASHFGAKMKNLLHGDTNLRGITCSVAMESLFQHMSSYFYWSPEIWVSMVTLIRGRTSVPDLLAEYVQSSRILFEQEDCNLYAEPFVTMQLASSYLKMMIDQALADKTLASKSVENWCQGWLSEENEKLQKDIHLLINSGLKNGGSLQNPKLFTLRYRLTTMVDVITYLGSRISHPEFRENDKMTGIDRLLSAMSRTSIGCHPVLHEYVSHVTTTFYSQESPL